MEQYVSDGKPNKKTPSSSKDYKMDGKAEAKNEKKENSLLTSKKKRRYEDSMEEILKDPENKLSQKISTLDMKSDSEYVSEGSDENAIDEEQSHSDDYVEQKKGGIVKKKKEKGEKKKVGKTVNIWDEKTNKLGKDEYLDFDNEAYEMLHRAKPEWPCMSIDFLMPEHFYPPIKPFYEPIETKKLFFKDEFPYTSYMVAGSMTNNYDGMLYVMKWYNMRKTKFDDDPDMSLDEEDEKSEENDNPFMRFERMKVSGNINKVKAMKNSYIVGYWSDKGLVEIVDIRPLINEIENNQGKDIENNELFKPTNKKQKISQRNLSIGSFKRSLDGFAMDWSIFDDYTLAAGGQDKIVQLYTPKDEMCSGFIMNRSFIAHDKSVEGIAWNPFDKGVFATCSVDRSIRIWDADDKMNKPVLVISEAHKSDVNVIAFNPHAHQADKKAKKINNVLLASGGDDGAIKVWDIRNLKNPFIDNINWHKGPITSIAWDPYDNSQLAASSEDNSVSIWDFAVEPDDNQIFDTSKNQIPQQLVFLHQGQENIKDIKFHPVYKNFLVSSAENGINVFKPNFEDDGDADNEEEEEDDDEDGEESDEMEVDK